MTQIHRPVEQPQPLEVRVMYVVLRNDGYAKRFDTIGKPLKDDSSYWQAGNHYPNPGEVLIPVDPWTAIKTHMCTFEELQLPEGARALLNIIK